jgi:uncharacterized membrane protein YeaQ/YmgE (transglycosylase-associated protein family)
MGDGSRVDMFLLRREGNDIGWNRSSTEVSMTITGIITAIIIGAIIGALGRLVIPGRQSMPVWLTIVVGIVAALLGSVIAGALGVRDTSGVDWTELLIQIVLAAIGVALVAGTYGRRRLN